MATDLHYTVYRKANDHKQITYDHRQITYDHKQSHKAEDGARAAAAADAGIGAGDIGSEADAALGGAEVAIFAKVLRIIHQHADRCIRRVDARLAAKIVFVEVTVFVVVFVVDRLVPRDMVVVEPAVVVGPIDQFVMVVVFESVQGIGPGGDRERTKKDLDDDHLVGVGSVERGGGKYSPNPDHDERVSV